QEHDDVGINTLINSGEPGSIAISGLSSSSEDQIGIHGIASNGLETGNFQIGVRGDAVNPEESLKLNIGVHGFAAGAAGNNIGVYGIGSNIGVEGRGENFGGRFYGGNYGLRASGTVFAGYFHGDVEVHGELTMNGDLVQTSDEQFKENITDYSGALEKVRNLHPVTFTYDTASYDLNFPGGMQYGLISQEVEQVIPELVSNGVIPPKVDSAGNIVSDSISYKGMNYLELTPILTKAVQELDDTIQEIVAKPEIPVLIAPENNDILLAKEIPEFIWHKADHAQFYRIDLSYTADMSDVFKSATTVDTLINPKIPIKNDTTVYWAVKAYNTFGESDYSEIRYVFYAYGFDRKKAQSYSKLSDANLKTNINDIDDALQKTMQLNGISFEWDTEQSPERNLEPGTNFGIIAQEIQPIFPEVVKTDANGFLYIDYTSLVPVLVEALKEQQTEINHLQQQMNDLASVVDDCCGDSDKGANNDGSDGKGNNNEPTFSQNVKLNNQKAIVLNQNVPNPFKEQTTIRFQVPETVKEARLVFIDNTGTVLKQVEIHKRGTGELIVYAQDLSAGMYSYYLVADGKTIASKKMVVSGK
ncbi:MAG: tail fiber domain-containing protein, partial [Bacteroidota bacterium]|nr:tail fiber domain-containing protein [Bacteroidota bacterium]